MSNLPPTHRALVLSSFADGPEIRTLPTPQPTPGSAIIAVLSTSVLNDARSLCNGTLPFPLCLPLVIGNSAIGRVAAVGTDATTLNPGQLVLFDCFIHGRDDPSHTILFGMFGGMTAGARKLMDGEWRNATYAEFAKVPLENCYPLNEHKLLKEFGYSIDDLAYMLRQIIPMGGLAELNLKPGETVIVAPASGSFGSAAVEVAIALGANVIAAARNGDALQRIAKISDRVKMVQLKGEVEVDAKALQQYGEVDAYLDFSPAAAAKSTHIVSCLMALRAKGRACFMGGIREAVAIPYAIVMFKSLELKGKFMYERGAVVQLIKMVENGLLKLGPGAGIKVAGSYALEDWDTAFDEVKTRSGWGSHVVFSPQQK